jgi:hypothetical protein
MSAWRSSLRSACQNRGDDGVRVARDAPTRSCRCFRQSPKAARPVAVLPPLPADRHPTSPPWSRRSGAGPWSCSPCADGRHPVPVRYGFGTQQAASVPHS